MAKYKCGTVSDSRQIENPQSISLCLGDIQLYKTITELPDDHKMKLLSDLREAIETQKDNNTRLIIDNNLIVACLDTLNVSTSRNVITEGLRVLELVLKFGADQSTKEIMNDAVVQLFIRLISQVKRFETAEVVLYLRCFRHLLKFQAKKGMPVPRIPFMDGIFCVMQGVDRGQFVVNEESDAARSELLRLMNFLIRCDTPQDIEAIAHALLLMIYDKCSISRSTCQAFKCWVSFVDCHTGVFLELSRDYAELIWENILKKHLQEPHCSPEAVAGLFSCLVRLIEVNDPVVQDFVKLFDEEVTFRFCSSRDDHVRRQALTYMTSLLVHGRLSESFRSDSAVMDLFEQMTWLSQNSFVDKVVCARFYIEWYHAYGIDALEPHMESILTFCVSLLDDCLSDTDSRLVLEFFDNILHRRDVHARSLMKLFSENGTKEVLGALLVSTNHFVATTAQALASQYEQMLKDF